jgi:hypothetical protein
MVDHKEIMQSRVDIDGIVIEEDDMEIIDLAKIDQRKLDTQTKT